MTPDTAAIAAVTKRLHEAAKTGAPCDLEACASLAVTTLQGLGWQPPAEPNRAGRCTGCDTRGLAYDGVTHSDYQHDADGFRMFDVPFERTEDEWRILREGLASADPAAAWAAYEASRHG